MRFLVVLFTLGVVLLTTPVRSDVPNWMVPSPISIAITIGRWVLEDRSKEQVYYIQVKSVGVSETDARNQAFQFAVDQAVGSLVLSETEVQNGNVIRHDVLNYSSGYIHHFEYVDQKYTGQGVELVVDVWVKGSSIADRIVPKSQHHGDLQGNKIAESLQSIDKQNHSGDAVIKSVLTDFPERAWNVHINNIEYLQKNRTTVLHIDFVVWWKEKFIDAFEETISTVGEETRKSISEGASFERKACVFCGRKNYKTDQQKANILTQEIYQKYPHVLVTIFDSSRNPLYKQCWFYDNMLGIALSDNLFESYGDILTVHADTVLENSLQLDLSNFDIKRLDTVDLQIVRKTSCPFN